MSNKNTELEQLKKLSPYSLPDDPSQSGWSAKQIKAKFYQGLFYVHSLLSELRDETGVVTDVSFDDETNEMTFTFSSEEDNENVTKSFGFPTKLSDFVNDSGFITSSSLSSYVTSSALATELEDYVDNTTFGNTLEDYAKLTNLPTKLSDLTNDSGYITSSALSGYATTSAIANMTTASSTLTSDKIVVGNGNKTLKTTSYSVSDIVNIAEGKSSSYSSYAVYDGEKYYICVGNAQQTSGTSVEDSSITKLEITGSTIALTSYQYLYKISSLETVIDNINISDTKNGDIFLIVQTELPDFWVNTDGESWDLEILETTKVDLSTYVTNVSYDSSSHKIQKTIDGSTTDVVDLDNFASLNNSTGAISIGGVSKTPLYSHQTMYYRPISVAGTEKIGNTTSTALNFLNSGNVTFTYDSGLKASVDLSGYATQTWVGQQGYLTSSSLSSYVPTSRKVNGKALSSDITLTASDVGALSSSTAYVSSINGSSGAITNIATTSQIPTNNNQLTNGAGYQTQANVQSEIANGVPYTTTEPSSANENGKLKFVVLDSEPTTKYDGYYYIITAPQVTLISFTINNASYQAESGMTWAEWVASSYNTNGWQVSNTRIINDTQTRYVVYGGVEIAKTDEIVADRAYSTAVGGGGGNND